MCGCKEETSSKDCKDCRDKSSGCNDDKIIVYQTTVGIKEIIPQPLTNSFKVVLTNDTEYTIQLPNPTPPDDPNDGEDGQDGQDGESITITNYEVNDLENGDKEVVITFSDETIVTFTAPKGETGEGEPGEDGANGRTIHSGVDVAPVELGENGDHYVRLAGNFPLYKKEAGAWVLYGNLKGLNGNSLKLAATIDAFPVNQLGDSAIELGTYDLYEAQIDVDEDLVWVLVGNLKGPAGNTGATGLKGRGIHVYVQDTAPTGGTYYDGDVWIIDDTLPAPIVVAPVVSYTRAINITSEVDAPYSTEKTFNGSVTATINTILPNDIIFVCKVKFTIDGDEVEEEHTINIRAGMLTKTVPIFTGETSDDPGVPPFTPNPIDSVCVESFYSLADVSLSNYADFSCPV